MGEALRAKGLFACEGLEVDGQSFELKQFHFHVPSENHFQCESFPMEIHRVHQDGAGDLMVVALMVNGGWC